MPKKLSDVLAGTNRSKMRKGATGSRPGVDYASRMPDERDFVGDHTTQEYDDRVGNEEDVYNASNVNPPSEKYHGHIPKPEDENQYRQHNEQNDDYDERPVYTNPRTGETSRSLPPELRTDMGYQTEPTSSAVTRSPRPTPNPRRSSNTAPSTSPRPTMRPVREENQVGEEKEMMKRQLHFIKYAADEIMGHVDKTDDPEEWFQNKLAGLHNSIKGLHAYIEGDKRLEGDKEMPQIPNMKNEEAEGDERVQPKDTRGKKNLRMITGEVKESNNGSPKRTASEQARDRFDKKQERKEMRQEREENDN